MYNWLFFQMLCEYSLLLFEYSYLVGSIWYWSCLYVFILLHCFSFVIFELSKIFSLFLSFSLFLTKLYFIKWLAKRFIYPLLFLLLYFYSPNIVQNCYSSFSIYSFKIYSDTIKPSSKSFLPSDAEQTILMLVIFTQYKSEANHSLK